MQYCPISFTFIERTGVAEIELARGGRIEGYVMILLHNGHPHLKEIGLYLRQVYVIKVKENKVVYYVSHVWSLV